MFNKVVYFIFILIFPLLLACTSKPAPEAMEAKKAPEVITSAREKVGWEAEWDQVQKEARKEGSLVLYTTTGVEMRQAFSEALKEYGITLDVVAGRAVELEERISRERRAGIYNADLFLDGIATMVIVSRSAGLPLSPLLILPEVKDPKVWYKGKLNFVDKENRVLAFIAYVDPGIHINTDIVKPGDIKSMQDLLSPKWKGKIILNDPTIDGRGQNFLKVAATKLGEDYIKQLAKQEPLLTRDMRQLADWVAKGRYPIGVGVFPDQYQEYKRAGAPITNLILEDVSYLLSGAGNVGYMDKAPHPNASRVFVNWLLSRKGQKVWQDIRVDQSARIDMPVDHLVREGLLVRKEEGDYYDTRTEVWQLEEESRMFIVNTFSALKR